MSRIAFLPIDNRPVCYQLPKLITAQAKEHSIFLPDITLMGDLTKTANITELFNWIKNLENIDIFILSLDTIAYGGLIPSRRSNEHFNSIIDRINKLFELLCEKEANIYAFSSIMRISNNNINEEEKEYWSDWGKKIFEYSYNFHKTGETKTAIPSDILNDYLETRKRNFEVNKYYIKLKQKGIIDTLVFSKDDCSEYGLNVIESKELKKLSNNMDNIFIKTGADEIPLTLLSRAINKDKNIKIYPLFIQPDSVNKISNYEDIPVKESVEEQIKLSGGIVSDEKNSDIVLLVNNFEDKQGELVMGVDVPLFEGELLFQQKDNIFHPHPALPLQGGGQGGGEKISSELISKVIMLPHKPFCAADIRNANGSDNNFVEKLLKTGLDNFYGYAAWNTTGNTLGSVLSAALTYFKAKTPSVQAFNELQTIRFLDDWGYQANVRAKLRNNTENLTNNALKTEMQKYEKIITNKFSVFKKIDYYYPWNRFFEIGIKSDSGGM